MVVRQPNILRVSWKFRKDYVRIGKKIVNIPSGFVDGFRKKQKLQKSRTVACFRQVQEKGGKKTAQMYGCPIANGLCTTFSFDVPKVTDSQELRH